MNGHEVVIPRPRDLLNMSAPARSTETATTKQAIAIILDDDESRQLHDDQRDEIRKLRKTVAEQEQLINQFLESAETETETEPQLQTENDELKRNVCDLRAENDTLKREIVNFKRVLNENEVLFNDFFESRAKDESYVPQDPCAICQEEFQSTRTLKCHHSFHSECIRKWLNEQGSCPVCRSAEEG